MLELLDQQEAAAYEHAFPALVQRQARFVFRVAYSVLRNAHDSEDVVQETFLKIYRARSWNRLQDERAFLARTAWRLALDRLRKIPFETCDFDLPSPHENPEQAAITADWDSTVHRLIDTLPQRLRLPLALSAVEELKSTEIAALMGIPEGTVRRRLMRARQILKQKLLALVIPALVLLAVAIRLQHPSAPPKVAISQTVTHPFQFRTAPMPPFRALSVSEGRSLRRQATPKPLPKQEQFPAAAPLSDEERLLLAFVKRDPNQAVRTFADLSRRTSEPLEVEPLETKPLQTDGPH